MVPESERQDCNDSVLVWSVKRQIVLESERIMLVFFVVVVVVFTVCRYYPKVSEPDRWDYVNVDILHFMYVQSYLFFFRMLLPSDKTMFLLNLDVCRKFRTPSN